MAASAAAMLEISTRRPYSIAMCLAIAIALSLLICLLVGQDNVLSRDACRKYHRHTWCSKEVP